MPGSFPEMADPTVNKGQYSFLPGQHVKWWQVPAASKGCTTMNLESKKDVVAQQGLEECECLRQLQTREVSPRPGWPQQGMQVKGDRRWVEGTCHGNSKRESEGFPV